MGTAGPELVLAGLYDGARDEFGVPAHIPPELSTEIKHTYYVPPQYYPFLKKLGDDTPELKPFMDKLINGEMTFDEYETMFYQFAKPLKIHRSELPMPYRTAEEIKKEAEVDWESAWLSFRQRVLGDYNGRHASRDFFFAMSGGALFGIIYLQRVREYRKDMKLFYVAAPELKLNWVKALGCAHHVLASLFQIPGHQSLECCLKAASCVLS